MYKKPSRDVRTQVPRSFRHRPRVRYLLAVLILCGYYYFSTVDSSPFHTHRSPYQIQAKFPRETAAGRTLRLQRRGQVEDAFRHAWKGYREYAWLHDELMPKARQLGDFLCQAFNTNNGLPVPYYYWKETTLTKLPGEDNVIIAQIASLSMEFVRLSQVTGDPKYAAKIQLVTNELAKTQNLTDLPGMWPLIANCSGEGLSFQDSRFSLGVLADSAFEYLPKTHLLNYRVSNQYIEMYRTAHATFSEKLFFRPLVPGNPDILMTGNMDMSNEPPRLDGQFQHLACFVGGMVALGSRISNSKEELETAGRLTDGCVWGYSNTPSGIMPDFSQVEPCQKGGMCVWNGEGNGYKRVDDPSYQLRPEAIESVFIMYRLTADPSWLETGWRMFEAIAKHTRTSIAHARLVNVMDADPGHEDSMESFWLGETLKYFYLLYSEPELVSLDEFVLNTEAHPFRWKG
ncbi:class I alpha-mannosidase [Diplocarpon rosae]|nr:class I alpha-mannosidase [Diplocarpon rosae]